ncbi:blastula protease 10-like isoform X2 [Lytechinus variegatus]|uniref:blastula protease 10-like isoform X2 n=1 Tax=Lytechinus variegatus TaxID=7654 RepID=UPI001BB27D9B|nr:blastula protease 10-like isoform X2 [Lytechinus variegatus]
MKFALALCAMLCAYGWYGVISVPFGGDQSKRADEAPEVEFKRDQQHDSERAAELRKAQEAADFGTDKRGDEGTEAEFKRDQNAEKRPAGDSYTDFEADKVAKRSSADASDACKATTVNLASLWGSTVEYAFAKDEIKTDVVIAAIDGLNAILGDLFTFVDITDKVGAGCQNSYQNHYICIKNDGSGCYSYIGKTSGEYQTLMLQKDKCENKVVIQHEFIHALGAYHEQQREDAPLYETLHKDNIKDNKVGNFEEKVTAALCTDCPFSMCDAMHYRRKAFSKNGNPTIEANDPGQWPMQGQQIEIKPGDICVIHSLYQSELPQRQCASSGTLCEYGTGVNPFGFECCYCPRNLEDERCQTFVAHGAHDKHYELSAVGDSVVVKSQESQKYSLNQYITFFVTAPEGKSLSMTVNKFGVEPDPDCYWDMVTLYYQESILQCPENDCGDDLKAGMVLTSESNFFMARLYSDDYMTDIGFEFKFEVVEPVSG